MVFNHPAGRPMIRRLVFRLFSLMLAGLSLLTGLESQTTNAVDFAEDLTRAVQRSWGRVLRPGFVAGAANQLQAQTIQATQLKIISYSNINAFSRPGEIVLPIGLLFSLNQISDAYLIGYSTPSKFNKIPAYSQYLVDQELQARGGIAGSVRSFPNFAGISDQLVSQIISSPEYGDRKESFMVDQLSLILGHELGHIVLRHSAYSQETAAQARSNESDADRFGFNLASRSGFHPIAGLATAFLLFAAMDHGATSFKPGDTHPAASCRMVDLLRGSLASLEDSPGSAEGLATAGMSKAKLNEWIATLSVACAGNQQ